MPCARLDGHWEDEPGPGNVWPMRCRFVPRPCSLYSVERESLQFQLLGFLALMIGRFAPTRAEPCWLTWSGINRSMCYWAVMRRFLPAGSGSTQEWRLSAEIAGPATSREQPKEHRKPNRCLTAGIYAKICAKSCKRHLLS